MLKANPKLLLPSAFGSCYDALPGCLWRGWTALFVPWSASSVGCIILFLKECAALDLPSYLCRHTLGFSSSQIPTQRLRWSTHSKKLYDFLESQNFMNSI